MLTKYMQAAMRRAKYEMLEDGGDFYGEIPGLQGVWATGENLEECRDELASALEDWLLFRLSRQLPAPRILGTSQWRTPSAHAARLRHRDSTFPRFAFPGKLRVVMDLKLQEPVTEAVEVDAETLAAIRRGAEAAEQGRTVSLEQARKMIPEWITKFASQNRR